MTSSVRRASARLTEDVYPTIDTGTEELFERTPAAEPALLALPVLAALASDRSLPKREAILDLLGRVYDIAVEAHDARTLAAFEAAAAWFDADEIAELASRPEED